MTDEHETPSETAEGKEKGLGAIAKTMARIMWSQQWRAANPDGDAETRRAAWQEVRAEETKKARKLIKALENSGITMTMVAKERQKGKKDDAQDEDDLEHQD